MAYCGKVTDRKSGTPLEGIRVSDGRNIVLTDQEGRFSLEGWKRAHVIHVDVLTTRHSDWFIYINGHVGDFDFCIDPVVTPSDYCFLHISDTEIENRPFTDQIFDLRQRVKENRPAFFIHTGDLCRDDGVARHYQVMNCETMGCPVRYTIGNHDFRGDDYGESIYEKYYGPTWYSFDCGEIHFVALQIKKGDKPSGYQLSDQWIWLQNDLKSMKPNQRLIVLDHDLCCWDEQGFCPTVEDVTIDLRGAGLIAWIYGHYHFNFLHEYDCVLNICSSRPDSGGIDSSAAGIRKINVQGHTLTTEMLYHTIPCDPEDPFMWRTQLEGRVEFSTPLIIGDNIFVATMDDDYPKRCGIYRLKDQSGEIQWYYATADGIKNDIAYEDGKIYAQDTKGYLYCLNAATGDLIWKVCSDLQKGAFTRSGVLIVDSLVITGNPAHVYAYHKHTGDLVWRAEPIYSENTPARFVYDPWREQLLISCHWNGLCALDIHTGKQKWINKERPLWFRSATPLVTEKAIYAAGYCHFAMVDPMTGSYMVVKESGEQVDVSGAPALMGDTLYFPTFTGGVIAVDSQTLEEKNRFLPGVTKLFTAPYMSMAEFGVEASPVLRENEVCFAALDGYVYIYERANGQLRKKLSMGAPCTVSPVVRKQEIITADFLGRVTKFNL